MVKENTKGQKLILEENASTISFYRYMSMTAAAVYTICGWLLFNNYSNTDQVLVVTCLCVLMAGNRFLVSMARTSVSDTGAVMDEGCDLNMEGGLAEHVKDVIIVTAASLCLATVSSYFWLLLLLAPVRATHLLWKYVIQPWVFAGSESTPESTEETEKKALKKQRKLERRQRRGY